MSNPDVYLFDQSGFDVVLRESAAAGAQGSAAFVGSATLVGDAGVTAGAVAAEADLATGATLAADGVAIAVVETALSGAAFVSAEGNAVLAAAAGLAGAGVLAPDAVTTRNVSALLAGDSSVASEVRVGAAATAAFAASAVSGATAGLAIQGEASLSGEAGLELVPEALSSRAVLVGEGGFVAAAVVAPFASARLEGGATFVGAPRVAQAIAAELRGRSEVVPAATRIAPLSGTLVGAAEATGDATRSGFGAAALGASSGLAADVDRVKGALVVLSGRSTLESLASRTTFAVVGLPGLAVPNFHGVVVRTSGAALATTSSTIADATVRVPAVGVLGGGSSLAAVAQRIARPLAVLHSEATFGAQPQVVAEAQAAISGRAAIQWAAVRQLFGAAELAGTAAFAGRPSLNVRAVLVGEAAVASDATRATLAGAALSSATLADFSAFVVQSVAVRLDGVAELRAAIFAVRGLQGSFTAQAGLFLEPVVWISLVVESRTPAVAAETAAVVLLVQAQTVVGATEVVEFELGGEIAAHVVAGVRVVRVDGAVRRTWTAGATTLVVGANVQGTVAASVDAPNVVCEASEARLDAEAGTPMVEADREAVLV